MRPSKKFQQWLKRVNVPYSYGRRGCIEILLRKAFDAGRKYERERKKDAWPDKRKEK